METLVATVLDMATEKPSDNEGYTIDELAAISRVPSRTIRFYQSQGALQKPEMRGRVAYYVKAHAERLTLIAQLQDRGLRIDAIRELTTRIDRGDVDVGEWLGLEAQLGASWSEDRPRTMSEKEILELAGAPTPGLLSDLVRAKIVERQGDVFLVRSPALLRIAFDLSRSGVDFETAAGFAAIVRKSMSRAAVDLVAYFLKNAKEGFGRNATPEDLGKAFEALRPSGLEAVRLIFAQEIGREVRKLTQSGKTVGLSSKTRRSRS